VEYFGLQTKICHLKHCCLFLRIIGSLHWDMSCEHKVLCFAIQIPSETFWMLSVWYGGRKVFMMAIQASMIRAVGGHQLWQMMKPSSMCVCGPKWPIKEYLRDISVEVGITEAFTVFFMKKLMSITLVKTSDSSQKYLDKHNVTALKHPPYSHDLSLPDCLLLPQLKTSERTTIHEHWQSYRKIVSMNSSKGFTNTGKRLSLPTGTILEEMLCK
jgi:hypothetical protein